MSASDIKTDAISFFEAIEKNGFESIKRGRILKRERRTNGRKKDRGHFIFMTTEVERTNIRKTANMRSLIDSVMSKGRITVKKIEASDAADLKALTEDPAVYKYLPALLFEKKYDDVGEMIAGLYDEEIDDSLILGIYARKKFCGIIELYGYRQEKRKISVGYRLLKRYWGWGIATSALSIIVDYLCKDPCIDVVTASTISENVAAEKVLEKNGFTLIERGVYEDWGVEEPVLVDKWSRKATKQIGKECEPFDQEETNGETDPTKGKNTFVCRLKKLFSRRGK